MLSTWPWELLSVPLSVQSLNRWLQMSLCHQSVYCWVTLIFRTFSQLSITVAEAQKAGAVTINYGMFINTVISFLIVAFAVFLLVKGLNSLKRKEEAPPEEPTTKECPHCFSEIPIRATRCGFCTSEIPAA
jgi:large conductance mechanosensitive channel protein